MTAPERPKISVPPVANLETALRLYYERIELTFHDIMELFQCSRTTATRLRKLALAEQAEAGIALWNARGVNTKCAYKAWGIDVRVLEDNLGRLTRLRLNK